MYQTRILFAAALVLAVLTDCGNGSPLAPNFPSDKASAPQLLRPLSKAYTLLHRFSGRDGASPEAQLVAVGNTLYGTTAVLRGQYTGIAFSITTTGTFRILHTFGIGEDGAGPSSPLLYHNGIFYGTTAIGGAHGHGTVFSLTPSGTEAVLYSFTGGPDGDGPYGGLISVSGKLYGVTSNGGSPSTNGGVAFSMDGAGNETVLHAFQCGATDGCNPEAQLANVNGTLYGTTLNGGKTNNGTVFQITRSGQEHPIYSFKRYTDGAAPIAGLTYANGALYGTTVNGGDNGDGIVFKVTLSGRERILHQFGSGSDGACPWTNLLNVKGVFYGTTEHGGSSTQGTVFRITPSGTETLLHDFAGPSQDGAVPLGGLVRIKHILYGTTSAGGKGAGTVFALGLPTAQLAATTAANLTHSAVGCTIP